MEIPASIFWKNDSLYILDQTLLPQETRHIEISGVEDACLAIRKLQVRGAPAIGILAAFALGLELQKQEPGTMESFQNLFQESKAYLLASRPTAVNLANALRRMEADLSRKLQEGAGVPALIRTVAKSAQDIHAEDRRTCLQLGEYGAELISKNARVLTHCHTGALATGGIGTALGALHTAHRNGKNISVYACETRPLLQGARITSYELQNSGVPVTLITDNAAAHIMRTEKIDLVILGADRIAINGDTANKIGTFGLAVLARHFKIPFYVSAPESTLDRQAQNGGAIPIEERDPDEVRHFRGVRSAPDEVAVRNPAFDVTPAELISAIITENGVFHPPYDFSEPRKE